MVDKFNDKQYKWTEISRIDLRHNEGRAPGGYIALYLNNSEDVIRIQDIKLKGKKFEILDDLIHFHDRYGKRGINR